MTAAGGPRLADRILLELAPLGGRRWADVPASVRLRRVLKALARGYGFRVVTVVEIPARPPLQFEDDQLPALAGNNAATSRTDAAAAAEG